MDKNRMFGFLSLLFVTLLLGATTLSVLHLQGAQKSSSSASSLDPQPIGGTGSWNLVYDDEFNATSLDTTKWSVCYPWDCHSGGNGELMVYTAQNLTEANGQLTIKADKQNTCEGSYCANYGSSLIQTGKSNTGKPSPFTFTYGFTEARLMVPYGTGYFPAFWMLGPQDEIDMMEVFGNKTNFSCGVHLGHYTSSWGCQSHGVNTTPAYHTFGVDWEPTKLTFYYDGNPVGSSTDPKMIPNDAEYILLNFAIGANFMPPPDSSTVFPAYLNADYVRVWKPSTSTNPTVTTSTNPTTPPITTSVAIPTSSPTVIQSQKVTPTVTKTPTTTPIQKVTSLPTTPLASTQVSPTSKSVNTNIGVTHNPTPTSIQINQNEKTPTQLSQNPTVIQTTLVTSTPSTNSSYVTAPKTNSNNTYAGIGVIESYKTLLVTIGSILTCISLLGLIIFLLPHSLQNKLKSLLIKNAK